MSAQEIETQEFSSKSLRKAFSDFLTEAPPRPDAARQNLSESAVQSPASQFEFEGTLRVDCQARGGLRSDNGTLIVSETAELYADIFVATAIIDGKLHGNIRATERVELGSHARVVGNIEAPTISIQPGALFDGACYFPSPVDEPDQSKSQRASSETKLDASESLGESENEEDLKPIAAVAR